VMASSLEQVRPPQFSSGNIHPNNLEKFHLRSSRRFLVVTVTNLLTPSSFHSRFPVVELEKRTEAMLPYAVWGDYPETDLGTYENF
jgi:hypothetical protein